MEGVMKLTKSERRELQRQAGTRTGRADSARHARVILLLADGLSWAEIRAKLDCSDSYIDRWRKRFSQDRLAGLFARYFGRQRYKVTDSDRGTSAGEDYQTQAHRWLDALVLAQTRRRIGQHLAHDGEPNLGQARAQTASS
jgi:hypothetical protein